MLTKEKLLRDFKDSMPVWRKELTLYRYPRIVETFIDYIGVKQTYTKSDTVRFLNHILNSGLSKNYARWSAYILKQFYESLGIEFPLKAKELPQVEPGDVTAPVFGPDYIRSLVEAVKGKGTPMMKAYLSLSTTFGMRREELASLTGSSFSNHTITIKTVKGGEIRSFSVPEQIRPFVDDFNFRKVHPQTMTNLIKKIQLISGFKHEQGDGWHCVPPGELVLTKTGFKNIEEVKIGDFVYCGQPENSNASTGGFSCVVDTFVHPYEGDLITIKAHGLLPIQVTPNHPLLVKKKGGRLKKSRGASFHKGLRFLEADSLSVGDYLVVPKFISKCEDQILNFSPYIKKFGWGKLRNLRRGLPLDEDIGRFLGYYLADGAGSEGGNQLYFNKADTDRVKCFADIIRKKFGYKVRLSESSSDVILQGKVVKGSGLTLTFGGSVLRRFLQSSIKLNAHNANVPPFIFNAPIPIATAFLKGYFEGDGYIKWERRTVVASTVCRRLAIQIQALCTKVGIWANLRNSKSDMSRYFIEISKADAQRLFNGKTTIKTRGSPVLSDKKYYYCPIVDIDRLPYKGLVYNLETRRRNYCLNNVVVHNSIRRSLVTGLMSNGVPPSHVFSFMGWKLSSQFGTMGIYTKPTVENVERAIYAKHPFLKFWV
jgi:hypothetical protein